MEPAPIDAAHQQHPNVLTLFILAWLYARAKPSSLLTIPHDIALSSSESLDTKRLMKASVRQVVRLGMVQ